MTGNNLALVLGAVLSASGQVTRRNYLIILSSRRRGYRADQAGAELVSPAAMASALARLKETYDQPSELQGELVAFGIRGEGKFAALFATHPPLDDRIRALQERYGNK